MAPMAGDAEEPTEELNDPLIRLNAVQQNVRRRVLSCPVKTASLQLAHTCW